MAKPAYAETDLDPIKRPNGFSAINLFVMLSVFFFTRKA